MHILKDVRNQAERDNTHYYDVIPLPSPQNSDNTKPCLSDLAEAIAKAVVLLGKHCRKHRHQRGKSLTKSRRLKER